MSGLPLRKVSVSKNVTSEIRQKAPKAYPFLLKSVMCSFWRMAFASTYIQSCDEEAIQVQQQLCAGTSPNFLRFKSTTFSLVCENPLCVEYWYIFNEFEVSNKPPISLVTILAAILLEYVPEGLESCMSGRSKRSLTRKLGQADRRGQRKRKAKKFLCSRLPQLAGLFYKRPQRRTNSV